MLEPKTLAGFLAVVAFTITANLILKLGAGASEAERVFRAARLEVGGGARSIRLRRNCLRLPAAPSAAQHRPSVHVGAVVGVIVAASLVLGEPISVALSLEIACISLGIALVGATMNVQVRVATTSAETPNGGCSRGAVSTSSRNTEINKRLSHPVLISPSLAILILKLRIRRRAASIGKKSR